MPTLPIECDVHSIGEMIIGLDQERRNVILPRQALADNVWVLGAIGRWTLELWLIKNNNYCIDIHCLFCRILAIVSSGVFICPPSLFRPNTTRTDNAIWQIYLNDRIDIRYIHCY